MLSRKSLKTNTARLLDPESFRTENERFIKSPVTTVVVLVVELGYGNSEKEGRRERDEGGGRRQS